MVQQQPVEHITKTLILFLAMLCLGGSWSYAGSIPELKEDAPLQAQNFQSAAPAQWIFRENNSQEFLDLHNPFPSGSLFTAAALFSGISPFTDSFYTHSYQRDLRSLIGKQLFPMHFFL